VVSAKVTGRAVAPVFGRRAGDDHRINFPFAQDNIEVGAKEATVTSNSHFGVLLRMWWRILSDCDQPKLRESNHLNMLLNYSNGTSEKFIVIMRTAAL
jgi:hypothetical protein